MAAAAAAITAGNGDGDMGGTESDGIEVVGSGEEVEFGAELENI